MAGALVSTIDRANGTYTVRWSHGAASGRKLVLAAGLGNRDLAPLVGLTVPLHPDRGHVLVTERMRPLLAMPLRPLIRQTLEGTVMIGISSERAGFDDRVNITTLRDIAVTARRLIPALAGVRIVRSWAALRVMTPDEYPLYDESRACPGAFVANCHSGVTLAASHVFGLAKCIAEGRMADGLRTFGGARFTANAGAT